MSDAEFKKSFNAAEAEATKIIQMQNSNLKMFLLQCPKCNNRMRYQSKEGHLSGKKKKCVYCGKSFTANQHVVKKI